MSRVYKESAFYRRINNIEERHRIFYRQMQIGRRNRLAVERKGKTPDVDKGLEVEVVILRDNDV